MNDTSGYIIFGKKNNSDTFDILINSEIITKVSYDTSAPKTNQRCDFGDLENVTVDEKTFKIEDGIILTVYLSSEL